MKKIMMSLTVLALTVGAANAQKGSGGFKLGVNAGVFLHQELTTQMALEQQLLQVKWVLKLALTLILN